MYNISVETDPTLKGLRDDQSIEILSHTMKSENIDLCDILLIFGNNDLIRNLKKEYFNIDKNTDVIAFRLNDYDNIRIEGEIYICLPIAKENAELYNEPYEKEIARLIIHGALHLIGYEDDTESNRIEMRNLEDKYLKELKF